MLILLDTNFIVACMKSHVPLREQLEHEGPSVRFQVLERVLEEIVFLPAKDKKLAQLFLDSVKPEIVPSVGVTDDQLISYAKKTKACVATLDAGLKKRLKKEGIPNIALARSRVVFS